MTELRHPRVVNVRQSDPLKWDVYVGRTAAGLYGRGWGNPFSFRRHGKEAMRLYLDYMAKDPGGGATVDRAREELPGKVLGCWCAPGPCHGEVLARLADGEDLEAIRVELLEQLGIDDAPEAHEPVPDPETRDLFRSDKD